MFTSFSTFKECCPIPIDLFVQGGTFFPILFVECIAALVEDSTMWFVSELFGKLISQIALFAIFLWLFGLPAIKLYQKQEVMVISSIEHSGGILAPTVSVIVRNNFSMKGWRSENISSSMDVIQDQCGKASDIQRCILDGTYNLSDVVKSAHIGYKVNESLMESSLWREDFTITPYGRYFTLNIGKRITPDYAVDQIFLHLHQKFNYKIFIYHQKFFVPNTNILSFPVIIKDASSSMGSHYWNLAVTERFELNHPNDPCYEGSILHSGTALFILQYLCKYAPS